MSTSPTGASVATSAPSGATPQRGPGLPAPLRDVVAVVGVHLVLGVVAGMLWWLLVDPAVFTKAENGLGMGEVELGKRFNDDGWYAVIAAVLGLLTGAVLTWWRSRDPMLTSFLLLAGSGVAAGVMAVTGGLLGPPDPEKVASASAIGDSVPMALEVGGLVVYLVWPIAVLGGALLVLWSPGPDQDPRATR